MGSVGKHTGTSSSSSIGGAGSVTSTVTPLESFNNQINQTDEQRQAALAIYNAPRTTAFASNKSMVDKVPALKQMKDAMEGAPVGTRVAYFMGSVGAANVPIVRVYTKSSTSGWTWQEFQTLQTGNTVMYGGANRMSGWFKPLQSLADAHYMGASPTTNSVNNSSVIKGIKDFYKI